MQTTGKEPAVVLEIFVGNERQDHIVGKMAALVELLPMEWASTTEVRGRVRVVVRPLDREKDRP